VNRHRFGHLQSPQVSSTRLDNRKHRTSRLKLPPRHHSRKCHKHSDISSSSSDEYRSPDRIESRRSYNTSRRKCEEDGSSDEGNKATTARDRHRIRLRTFDGTGTFETFWAYFENCASYNRWNDADKLAHLKASLVGDAGQVLWDSDPTSVNTLSKLVQLLKARFGGSRQADKHRMELRLRRRKSGETLTVLHRDIRRLMALAHPSLTETAREEIACDYFVDALDNPDFALKVHERAPSTLDDALRVALQLEAWTKDAQRKTEERERHKLKTRGSGVTNHSATSTLETKFGNLQPPSKTTQPERQRPTARSSTTVNPSNRTPELDLKRMKEQIEYDLRERLKNEIRQEMQKSWDASNHNRMLDQQLRHKTKRTTDDLLHQHRLMESLDRTTAIQETMHLTVHPEYAGTAASPDISVRTVHCLHRQPEPLEPRDTRNHRLLIADPK